MFLHRTFLYGILLWAAGPIAAQVGDVSFEAELPDSVVVTASRLSEDARLTGRRITVWTARDMDALPVSSFDELLKTAGGVEVQSRGGFGVQSDITMRGSGFSGVLVLVDGVRLNDPMTGHFLADLPIPRSEIARIEVLRGPATALYGPDAIGGVIHIFTRAGLRSAASSRSVGPWEATASVLGGQNGLLDGEVSADVYRGASGMHVAGEWLRTDGEVIRNGSGDLVRDPANSPVRTDVDRRVATAAFTHRFPAASFFARAGADDRSFGAYHFYTAAESDTAREATSTYWLQARLESRPEAPTQWTVQLSGKQHDDRYVFNPQTPANVHTSRLATLQAHLSRTVSPTLTLTGGVSAEARGIDSNTMGTHADVAVGGFVVSRWRPVSPLTLTASARLDADPGYGLEPTPQLSVAYNRPGWALRAAAGRAVRAPSYLERYYNTTLANPRGLNLGNPDLKAERSWTVEAGADGYPTDGLSLHATVFARATHNLIDYVQMPADSVWLARNLLQLDTRGLELEASLHRSLSRTAALHLNASYTALDSDLGELDEGIAYKYALTTARHLLQGTATLSLDRWSLGAQSLWKDRLAGASYGVVHARAAYELPVRATRLVASLEVRNLFDEQYAEVFDAPMPGRWWLAGLAWEL